MYDEIERAVTGRPRRGFPRLGWLAVGLGTVLVLGVGGSMWTYHAVRDQLREFSQSLRQEPVVRVSEALAATLAAALGGLEPAANADLQAAGLDQAAVRDIIEGSLRIRGREGDLTADLHGDNTGGSLQLRSPEGEVRVDVARSDGGGELMILVPDWVPAVVGMPDTPSQRLSASAGEGEFGIVTWETRGEANDLVDAYRNRLEAEGYEVRAEHSWRGDSQRSASVVGTNESSGQTVFLGVSRDGDANRAVLAYGVKGE